MQRHRLGPLLYSHLDALGAGTALPKPVFVELWRRYEHHSRRNPELARWLARAVAALERQGVASVPYKGPMLAHALYGSIARRAFDDIDMLVRRRDVARASAIIEAGGYDPYYPLTPSTTSAMLDSHLQYHMVFAHRESGHLLELHWKTDPAFPVEHDTDDWWRGLGAATLLGEQVRAFTGEEQLLMSCVHAMRHQGYRLCWLVDVAEALRQPRPLDWRWIVDRATAIGAWRRLAVSLLIAHDLLDAPVPQDVLSAARADRRAPAVAQRITQRLFVPDEGDLGTAERLSLDLALFDRAGARARHALSVLFEPSFHEWVAWPLPRPLYPLYLPLRAWRIARKYAARPSSRGGRTAPAAPADGGAARE